MAEQKMISIEKMDEIMNDYFPAQEVIDFHGQELVVQKLIPLVTMFKMVQDLADACFDPETGEYLPEVFETAKRIAVVNAYTNVRLPEKAEHQYQLLHRTDLWEKVYAAINIDQMLEIEDAVAMRIRVRRDANRVEFEHTIQQVMNYVTEIGEQMNSVFGDVSKEDMKKLIGAIGMDGVDEAKLAQAVVQEQNRIREEKEGVADGE